MTTSGTGLCLALRRLQARFLSILPRICRHARIYFRQIRCYVHKSDLIAEVIALAWKWFLRLSERGKDACRFASVLASFAVKAVRCGRRITGQLKPQDVHSERAQQQRHFTVTKLPDISTLTTNPLAEALTDNTKTPPPDAAAFRCDWPAWLKTRCQRDRHLIREMMSGERTQILANRFQLSPARVSQLRREFHDDWARFCGELPSRN